MNRNGRHFEDAVRFHQALEPSVVRVCTWGILSETYTWLRYHQDYRHAERWLRETASLQSRRVLEVVFPSATTETEIHRNLSRFSDQEVSYVDAFSVYVVQSRPDIGAVFAFDHHLALAGKPVLPGPVTSARS